MSTTPDRLHRAAPRLMTLRVESPATLERALREFAHDVVIAAAASRDGDARERCFAEASATHQALLSRRLQHGTA